MNTKSKDYVPTKLEILIFTSGDVVTASDPSAWIDPDGNLDEGGWT